MKQFRVLSVFLTVDGEANVWGAGHWSIFVRFAGCSVGCTWCDTKYSWNMKGGEEYSVTELAEIVKKIGGGVKKVTITGGEPLEQDWPTLQAFMKKLLENNYNITVETAGTQNTLQFRSELQARMPRAAPALGQLTFVVDYKLPSSGFKGTMDWEHFRYLKRGDVVKFVIGSEEDFRLSCLVANRFYTENAFLASMYFSPQETGDLSPSDLFYYMKSEGLDQIGVGYNLQIHKYIFPKSVRDEEEGGIDFTKHTLGRDEFLKRMK